MGKSSPDAAPLLDRLHRLRFLGLQLVIAAKIIPSRLRNPSSLAVVMLQPGERLPPFLRAGDELKRMGGALARRLPDNTDGELGRGSRSGLLFRAGTTTPAAVLAAQRLACGCGFTSTTLSTVSQPSVWRERPVLPLRRQQFRR